MPLAHTVYGNGDPLIILHGLLGSSRNWTSIAKKLSLVGCSVITVDLRNHGMSPHFDDMKYPSMADDVAYLLSSLQLKEAIIMGHSMGGKTAMALALNKPQSVKALVVVDIFPRQYLFSNADLVRNLLGLDLHKIQTRSQADDLLAKNISQSSVRSFLLHNLNFDGEKPSWRPNLVGILKSSSDLQEFEFDKDKAKYLGPTLFIGGSNSEYVGNGDRDLIREFFPKARLAIIKGAGHWVHAERPEPFYQIVTHFLEQNFKS